MPTSKTSGSGKRRAEAVLSPGSTAQVEETHQPAARKQRMMEMPASDKSQVIKQRELAKEEAPMGSAPMDLVGGTGEAEGGVDDQRQKLGGLSRSWEDLRRFLVRDRSRLGGLWADILTGCSFGWCDPTFGSPRSVLKAKQSTGQSCLDF